jgi:enediyne biosynthesis protein E3
VKSFSAMLRRRLLGLQAVEINYARRGFRGATADVQARLEQIGAAFLGGYHAALEHDTQTDLATTLNSMETDLCGFGFEGAAMGFALLDCLTPWRRDRISELIHGAGGAHIYMVHVGVGWIWARLPVNFRRTKARLDPVLGWLAFDGWGFHEGFFHWPKYIAGQPAPKKLSGYERRVFDQGLGRSFWFVNGGNIELIAQTISNFSADRQSDLWSGIGLAATYAGIVSETSLGELHETAGRFQAQLAQGAAFAAKARQRAGNLTDYTSLATKILCGLPAADAARITDEALKNLSPDADVPAYEIWRRRIQNQFLPTRQLQGA